MIPVKDEITTRETPVVNYVLIAINVIVYLFMALAGPETQEAIVAKYAMIPAHFTDGVTLAGYDDHFHQHVHARRASASRREHALPVDLRR